MNKKQQQPRQKHVPQRSCVVCRQKFEKRQLTRIVKLVEAGIVVDRTGKRNGRGAYICDQLACWQRLTQKPEILANALKTTVTAVDLAQIATEQPTAVV